MKVGATAYTYQVYVPADWNAKQKWAVMLFLHGSGERGSDGLIQTEVGIGTAVRRHAERAKCVIVFPQCSTNRWWTTLTFAWSADAGVGMGLFLAR